jgi:vitamin B12 transporter
VTIRGFLVILSGMVALALPASSAHAQSDTIDLAPAIVKGFVPEKFMSGLKIQRIDSATLIQYRFQNISELLALYTPIAFKNYGPGQLNTASFRGTSANHTAVLWNGLNINAPTLGQTDFSTIPVAGFDQLSVQYGSAASVVGTDAVGGSILLGSNAPAPGLHVSAGAHYERFNNYQGQVGARYGSVINEKWSWSGKTNAYDGRLNNDFPYAERRGYALLPSQSGQRGLVQDLFFQSKDDQEISAHVWLTRNRLVLTPEDLAGRELTLTEAYRTMLRYRIRTFTVRTAWVRDIIDYAKGDFSQPDHATTDRFSNRIEKDFNLGLTPGLANIHFKAGGEWIYYRTRVAGYDRPAITENRADLFLLTRWQASPRLVVSLNLRQAFITGYDPPFTPSLGAEYQLVQKENYRLSLKGSYARSYRAPTLNERHWKDLGNPDVRPENGWNKEAGIEYKYKPFANHSFNSSVTVYHNRVKDWTYWNPAMSYHVENLQQVLARGVEVQAGYQYHSAILGAGINGGYAFNKSSQERAYDAYSSDIIGKQLAFVPLQSGNVNAFVSYKSVRLTGQVLAVDKRYTTFDNSQYLDGYMLVNILAESTIKVQKVALRFQGQVFNVGNAFYLNVRNNAMPGRSFALSLTFSYDSQ